MLVDHQCATLPFRIHVIALARRHLANSCPTRRSASPQRPDVSSGSLCGLKPATARAPVHSYTERDSIINPSCSFHVKDRDGAAAVKICSCARPHAYDTDQSCGMQMLLLPRAGMMLASSPGTPAALGPPFFACRCTVHTPRGHSQRGSCSRLNVSIRATRPRIPALARSRRFRMPARHHNRGNSWQLALDGRLPVVLDGMLGCFFDMDCPRPEAAGDEAREVCSSCFSHRRELAEETSSDAHVRKLTAEKKYRDAWLEGLELCRRIAAWPR